MRTAAIFLVFAMEPAGFVPGGFSLFQSGLIVGVLLLDQPSILGVHGLSRNMPFAVFGNLQKIRISRRL
jgi:hypothetical protein